MEWEAINIFQVNWVQQQIISFYITHSISSIWHNWSLLLLYISYMWNLIKENELMDTEYRLVVIRGGVGGVWNVKEVEMYKLPVIT